MEFPGRDGDGNEPKRISSGEGSGVFKRTNFGLGSCLYLGIQRIHMQLLRVDGRFP